VIFLSLYLQIVHHSSPTLSGLQLVPMSVGLIATSIGSGQVVARIGRYRAFPIIGTALTTLGLWQMSFMSVDLPYWRLALAMVFLGAGMGNVLQVLVLAVQNSVEPKDIGAGTSAAMFFRTIGGAFGATIFWAIMTARLGAELASTLSPADAAKLPQGSVTSSMRAVASLPEPLQHQVLSAFASAIGQTFLVAASIMAVGFVVAWFIPETPLRAGAGGHH
jgi:MFS family permease